MSILVLWMVVFLPISVVYIVLKNSKLFYFSFIQYLASAYSRGMALI
jgi:hypothetical protein